MFLERAHVLTLLATAGALGLAPGDTAAQSTPTDSLRIPALMISVGAGSAGDMGDWRDGGPVQVAPAQFLVGRHLAVEGEVTLWKTPHEKSAQKLPAEPTGGRVQNDATGHP